MVLSDLVAFQNDFERELIKKKKEMIDIYIDFRPGIFKFSHF